MVLSARILRDVASVNNFRVASGPHEMVEGDGDSYVYFQLVDTTLDTATEGYQPTGRRYVAAEAATLTLRMESLDIAKMVTRSASRPYALDGSIWRVAVLATDPLRGSVGWRLTLLEGGVARTGRLQPALCIQSSSLVR